jgi:hypothetical protein
MRVAFMQPAAQCCEWANNRVWLRWLPTEFSRQISADCWLDSGADLLGNVTTRWHLANSEDDKFCGLYWAHPDFDD